MASIRVGKPDTRPDATAHSPTTSRRRGTRPRTGHASSAVTARLDARATATTKIGSSLSASIENRKPIATSRRANRYHPELVSCRIRPP